MIRETVKPLLVGRLLRVLFGVATLALIPHWAEGSWILGTAMLLLGVSFLLGGLIGHPGCEITVLPSLILRKRLHCV